EAQAPAAEAAALMVVHGIVPKKALDPSSLNGPPSAEEAERWIESIGSACGIPAPVAGSRDDKHPATIASLARRLIERLGWSERVDLLIGRDDAPSWFPDEPEGLSVKEMEAVAYFLREKSWPD